MVLTGVTSEHAVLTGVRAAHVLTGVTAAHAPLDQGLGGAGGAGGRVHEHTNLVWAPLVSTYSQGVAVLLGCPPRPAWGIGFGVYGVGFGV